MLSALLPGTPVSWRRAAAVSVVAWAMLALIRSDLLTPSAADWQQDHALLSMDIAINRAVCDSPSKISTMIRVPYEARDRAELRSQPVREVLLARAGTLERYCLSVGSPIVNNENSLMWIESMLLRAAPGLSVDRLAAWLHWLRIGGLAFVGLTALRVGAGLAVSSVIVFVALVVLERIDALTITAYPQDFVMLLVTSAICALAAGRRSSSARVVIVLALVLGIWASFGSNMRTSHWPIYTLLPLMSLAWAEWVAGVPAVVRIARLGAFGAAFAVGYVAFQQFAIARHLPAGTAESAHHTTWHATVLGLAIPPNEVSRREQLEWSDDSASSLVRRLDPAARYVSAEYERALRDYYFGLWRRDAGEMAAVYLMKLRIAGAQMIEVLRTSPDRDSHWVWWVLRPAALAPNGWFILAGYLACTAAGLALALRRHPAGWFLLMLSLTAVVVHAESVVITTLYVAHYHAYLAFAVIAASLAAPLVAASAARAWAAQR